MKIAPRTPVVLSRQPLAASPSAEARRPTVRPLTSAPSGDRERTVLVCRRHGAPRARGPCRVGGSVRPRTVSGAPGDRPGLTSPPVSSSRAEVAGGSKPAPGFHGAVTEFKRRLIETTLTELGGNRTRAARALGLQRTYLLRLMREFAVHVPAGRCAATASGGAARGDGRASATITLTLVPPPV